MAPPRDLLRVLTCGSVDDGKSSLIGRLLYDAGLVPADQLAQLKRDSRHRPVGPEGLDLSLLLDGLEAEREQGITIDVAHRYFATPARAFVVADAPGHEQYTRNMVTGASTSELMLGLVDARKGILKQTTRHTMLAALFGIRDAVLVVNKMDLVDWNAAAFQQIAGAYRRIATRVGIERITAIPVSALKGGNIVNRSDEAKWFTGPTVLSFMEEVSVPRLDVTGPFTMPVQWINRSDQEVRGYAGTIARGTARIGERITVAGTKQTSRVARILAQSGEGGAASAGEAVTLFLEDAIDASRGDVLVAAEAPSAVADLFQAQLAWLDDDPMIPGRTYLARFGTTLVPASIIELKHRIDPNTSDTLPAKTLAANDVGSIKIATDHPVAFAPYAENRVLGGFILIDRLTSATVGAGMVEFALHRADNLLWENFDVTRDRRAAVKGQAPAILWFTGLSGAGKSTIANIVDRKLTLAGRHTYVLDGDNVRHGLNRDLGFTDADRVENIRRIAHVARLMADAGLIVLVSFISPFARERMLARETAADVPFFEIFVDTPLAVCEARDPKGLYRKARAGELGNFTGISSAFEAPAAPDVRLDGQRDDPETLADYLLQLLRDRGIIV